MTSKKISLTADDLAPALDALYENWVSEEARARHDANSRREAKQYILDAVWPGFEVLLSLINERAALLDTDTRADAVARFVSDVSCRYQSHNAYALWEDQVLAVAFHGVDPSAIYDDDEVADDLRCEAEELRAQESEDE
jgi:hypothetical protein